MYCKNCGNEIDADSLFCKNCGADLKGSSSLLKSSKSNHNLLSKFLNLEKKWQITILVFILWILVWIFFCFIVPQKDDSIASFMLFVIIIPFIIFFIWYYYRYLRNNPNNNKLSCEKDGVDEAKEILDSINGNTTFANIPCVIKIYPLMEFAKDHGKMQMVKNFDKTSSSYIISFVFTDMHGNITHVQCSESIKGLSSEQISVQKYSMCIKEYSDGHYELCDNLQSSNADEAFKTKM